jgi:thimet oligopeptidase
MFKVYSQLLGIEISKIEGAPVWHPTAALYQIRNKGSCAPLAHFYMDNLPRPGKRGGAAAFPLIAGRKVANGYIAPVSAVVANFNPPTGNKPSLLSHDQVETLFHEFGHIMHQTLTKAPYGSISGTSVPWDFVEAPSQMLEHWTWDEKILQDLSGHYLDLSKKIPSDLVKKMMAAKDFNQANFYMRQLLLATYDMTLHTSKQPVDIHSTYRTLAKDMIDMDIPVETHFGSTFSHIASGGYHAGYYGYLWSEVFADDMHSRFESAPQKLMDANMGKRYREIILESGSTSEPQVLLRRFLGREPNNNAFMQKFKR